MKTVGQRLNNISGQIEGVRKMMERGEECTKILVQLKAIKSAVEGVVEEVVNREIEQCLKDVEPKNKKLLFNLKKYV